MDKDQLGIREIQKEDIDSIIRYWLNSEPAFLEVMGVDLSKIPSRDQWKEMLTEQLSQSYEEKKILLPYLAAGWKSNRPFQRKQDNFW